jgi:glycosyltransferase involved in cell wall biosynthesis
VKKIIYIERKFWEWVSIEKVFRQIAEGLSPSRFQTAFQQVPYGNSLFGTIKNLLFFKKEPADIYHVTGQIHYITLILPAKKTVLTIHDLRFLHDRKGLRRIVLKKLLLDWPVRKLRYITAISDATKNEIMRYTKCDERKIRVIENPLRDEFVPSIEKPFDKTKPTLLQIGTTVNKNIPNLIRAIDGLSCRLVIIGRINSEIRDLLESHRIEFENKMDLSDAELVSEYERADIVSFCSTYEGFGLPIIEAQAMHKSVITSDFSPMKEVAGGAAIQVDPDDPREIRKGIEKIINDEALRAGLIRSGLENVARYQPELIARVYEEYYESILGDLEKRSI